ncbi:MAG: fructose-1,6-bisphosphatase [Thermodesulfobacteriota bacterium]
MDPDTTERHTDSTRYLRHLARLYPSIEAVSGEIIHLRAQLDLPKGTEHFISDIHGEYEAFRSVLSHASGSIRRKIDELFGGRVLSEEECSALGALIYAPERNLPRMLQTAEDETRWYRDTLHRMIEVLRVVSSKYHRPKVRRLLLEPFSDIVEELLYEQEQLRDKADYFNSIIDAVIETGNAKPFILVLARTIQRLAIDHLHAVGDIYDRGPAAEKIVDHLIAYHSVDIQWGNHDILWLGAAAGSEACIANVIRICLRYGLMNTLEHGYAVSLLPLASFAVSAYGDDPCRLFAPKETETAAHAGFEKQLIARMHKAITVIQFKLEAGIVDRRPEYHMEDRMLLDRIDLEAGTVRIGDKIHPLRDGRFPTLDPEHPFDLTPEEAEVIEKLAAAFRHSTRLQTHARFLFAKGGIYRVHNGNLLYHGCIPMDEDGVFQEMSVGDDTVSGKALMDAFTRRCRDGYFKPEGSLEKLDGLDAMWYLWCGSRSPLFGKEKMATFERYFVADPSTHAEERNIYYTLRDSETVARKILGEFGVDPEGGHIINGHVPVQVKRNERPVKAGGKLIVIDGGFAEAYQKTTGIAGFTLVSNSYGLLLSTHHRVESGPTDPVRAPGVHYTTEIIETNTARRRIRDTDEGETIRRRIDELTALLEAYRNGSIEPETELSSYYGTDH